MKTYDAFARCAASLVLWSASAAVGVGAQIPHGSASADQDRNEMEKARELFPPEVTWGLLVGKIPAPPGFDRAMAERLGQERFDAQRSGDQNVTGADHDTAAAVLLRLKADPDRLKPARWMTVRFVRSDYPVARGKTSGFFRTGQNADILLSGIDFNNAGGPLLFNHPMGIATDGKRLLLADTWRRLAPCLRCCVLPSWHAANPFTWSLLMGWDWYSSVAETCRPLRHLANGFQVMKLRVASSFSYGT
jgi:hypothetical protein